MVRVLEKSSQLKIKLSEKFAGTFGCLTMNIKVSRNLLSGAEMNGEMFV